MYCRQRDQSQSLEPSGQREKKTQRNQRQPMQQKKQGFSKDSRSYAQGKNKQKNTITFMLIADDKFGVQIPYSLNSQDTRRIVKDKYRGEWSTEHKVWLSQIENYKNCFNQLKAWYSQSNKDKSNKNQVVNVQKIPDFVLNATKDISLDFQIRNNPTTTLQKIKYNNLQLEIDPKSLVIYPRLYDFQKQSLAFGIKKHGRILLADQMGVGKTLQSIAIASVYRHQWPLLIVCPSLLRLNWKAQLLKWLPQYIKEHQIQVYTKGGQSIRQSIKVMIISYDLAWKMVASLQSFKIAIVDEAHYLKNSGNKRSDILTPYLSNRKRVLILTGTPALAKPRQIYNLISIVRPDLFFNFKEFGYRYCDPKVNPWSRALEYQGCQNAKQLHYLLKDKIMIRRLKKEVLPQLPDKQRQKIVVDTDNKIVKEIKQLLSGFGNVANIQDLKMQNFVVNMLSNNTQSFSNDGSGSNSHQAISQAYSLTGKAKLQSCKQYILEMLQNDVKVIVFAHHMAVLDGIQKAIKEKHFNYMRIDGTVSKQKRHQNVQNFQQKSDVMVALLSITAAGVGLTLTAASTIIFAELHWTPGNMIQAEDRAHRIGQKSSVNCHYLIGQNTLDQMLYQYLQRKIYNVSSFVDGKIQHMEMQNLKKGQKGKVSVSKDLQKPVSNGNSREILFKFQSVKPIIDKYVEASQIQSDISSQISTLDRQNLVLQANQVKNEQLSSKKSKISKIPAQIYEDIMGQKLHSCNSKQSEEQKNNEIYDKNFQIKSRYEFLFDEQSQTQRSTQSIKNDSEWGEQENF